ncbi:MAG TPA: hypothetical protein VIY47_08880 [Ignavibacteriaceae bacterium]
MNLVTKIILLTIIVYAFCISSAQERFTILTIQTNVDSAGLFIDGNFISVGNEFQNELEQGIHSIQIVEELRKWNTEIITDTIRIEKSGELFRRYTFNNQSLLNSNPQDVYVFENDSLLGFTPIFLDAGFKELRLEKPNYKTINITPEEISNEEIPKLQFTGQPSDQQFYGSTMFYALLGTAIAFGATTVYNKLKADDLYEEYKISGDRGLIDNIEHYDDQSAWTLIATELCIGAIIYFFLAE